MMHRHAFEAVDRTLRDIMGTENEAFKNIPFGNKVVVMGGDFRQVLPVVPKGSEAEIVDACLNQSHLWRYVKTLKLTVNMRVRRLAGQDAESQQQFSSYLLAIGNGTEEKYSDESGYTDLIKIPESLICDNTMDTLISHTYPELRSGTLGNRAILCPVNEVVDTFNNKCTDYFPGVRTLYYSSDSVMKDTDTTLYPTEFLNTLKFSGLPTHKIELKIGMPIILLRNIAACDGLCNGTRLICRQFYPRLIEAEIAFGAHAGNIVYIPRMPLIPSDDTIPFDFRRVQFPIKPAFAITINRAQGQTLDFVGLWLDEPVFGHGQLYVALSRVSSLSQIKIAIQKQAGQAFAFTRNIVYSQILNY
jgi:ATP-dependent DNA helicase PIF1